MKPYTNKKASGPEGNVKAETPEESIKTPEGEAIQRPSSRQSNQSSRSSSSAPNSSSSHTSNEFNFKSFDTQAFEHYCAKREEEANRSRSPSNSSSGSSYIYEDDGTPIHVGNRGNRHFEPIGPTISGRNTNPQSQIPQYSSSEGSDPEQEGPSQDIQRVGQDKKNDDANKEMNQMMSSLWAANFGKK